MSGRYVLFRLLLAFAALAAREDRPGLVFFLALAPLIPVAGIAAAFGPGVDPTFEIGLAAPLRSSKLLLIRCTAVLVASLVLINPRHFPAKCSSLSDAISSGDRRQRDAHNSAHRSRRPRVNT